MTIKSGSNWTGSYSRFSYETTSAELKRYFALLKEKNKAVLDDDFNFAQDALLTQLRRAMAEVFGSGSPNDGFKIVGTSANNDFTITGGNGTVDGAGVIYVGGIRLILPSNTTYLTQEIAPPAISPPGAGTRTDTVYVDVWFDEIAPGTDGTMIDPTLGVETSRRLKLKYQVLVSAGGAAPANYTDGNGIPHYTAALATVLRTTSNQITAGMVTDVRQPLYPNLTVKRLRDYVKYVVEQEGMVFSDSDQTQLWTAINSMVADMVAAEQHAVVINGAVFEGTVDDGDVVRWDTANNRFATALADGPVNSQAVGIADVTNDKVYCFGQSLAVFSGLTPGARYYLNPAVAGGITTAIPANNRVLVGIAKSATTIFIDIDAIPDDNPVGEMKMYAGSSLPAGYLWADGSAVSRTTYAALFAAIGTVHGVGNGSTTFNLPDMRGRAPIGAGQGAGLSARSLGQQLGAETHVLAAGEIPAHTHPSNAARGRADGNTIDGVSGIKYFDAANGSGLSTGQNAGGGGAHNNMQPSLVVNYIIRY